LAIIKVVTQFSPRPTSPDKSALENPQPCNVRAWLPSAKIDASGAD
jgi:hypothetical protein